MMLRIDGIKSKTDMVELACPFRFSCAILKL